MSEGFIFRGYISSPWLGNKLGMSFLPMFFSFEDGDEHAVATACTNYSSVSRYVARYTLLGDRRDHGALESP